MRTRFTLAERLWFHLINYSGQRDPDKVIGPSADPYLLRWYLVPRNRLLNVYFHHMRHSDDDRALHSHPYMWNLSVILKGSYVEHTADGAEKRSEGSVKFRWGPAFHRLELTEGHCWTLFVTGPRVRLWGFRCPKGFVPWHDFVAYDAMGASVVGRGCGEYA